jgi:hypothetical protein
MVKLGWIDTYHHGKKPFEKKPEKYCEHCKKIFSGPDTGAILEFPHDTSRDMPAKRYNGHRLSFETCPDCLSRGKPKFGIE